MKVGVIGTGNMGSILIEAFLDSGTLQEEELSIFNRTETKALALQERYPGMEVASSPSEIAVNCELLFICVKPLEMFTLFGQLKEHLSTTQCAVSITSPVSVEQMESILPCRIARFIPSITNKVLSGVSLLTFGRSCDEEWRNILTSMAAAISEPIEIDNSFTRVSSDIVSCGPAFFSYLAREFIHAASGTTGLDEKTATVLTEKMLIGLGDLLKSGEYTLPTLQEKVCVKGGITGEGIAAMESIAPDMFTGLFEATHRKFKKEIGSIEKQFQYSY